MDLIYRRYVDFPAHAILLYNKGFCMCAATMTGNLKLVRDQEHIVWAKVCKEIKEG